MRLLLALLLISACKSEKPPEPPPPAATAPAPTLSPNAPADKPVSGRFSAEQQAKINELQAEDMKKWPDVKARFAKGLSAGEHLFVTTTLTSPGKTESVFIAVSSIAGTKIIGVISSEIMNVAGYKANDRYTLEEAAVTDWLIAKPDGSEEGNLVGKYLDTVH